MTTSRIARAAIASITSLAGTKAVFAITDVPPAAGRPTRAREAEAGRYTFARDGVLWTSFDLVLHAVRPHDAKAAEIAALAEIERLSAILSTYDSSSEISRFQNGAVTEISPELREVLAAYELWGARSEGAINVRLNRVSRLWRDAARLGTLPDEAALRAAFTARDALNVDALGKGYIIDRAVAVARRYVPAGLLNVGGDLRAWGEVDWTVGVADPFNPAENARLVAVFSLRNTAVATSGSYARYVTISGQRYSHLIDPRTLRPVTDVSSATVIAADCLTANALSTATSVLGGNAFSRLAAYGDVQGHLVVSRTGSIHRGGLLAAAASVGAAGSGSPGSAPAPSGAASRTSVAAKPAGTSAATWPADFQVSINVAIGASAPATAGAPSVESAGAPAGGPGGGGFPGGMGRGPGRRGPGGQKRAYVAIWIEDEQHKLVRTVTVLGDNARYVPELTGWYQALGHADQRDVRSVTRATRPNGLYTVAWDGLDNAGQPLPQGTYTLKVEVNREHGRHVTSTAVITCDGQPHTFDLPATAESAASKIEYGPKSAPGTAAP